MKIRSLLGCVGFGGALLMGLGAARPAHAANFIVSNLNNAGVGSLRQAISNANSAPSDDTISFEGAKFASDQTLTLTSGEIEINGSGTLAINGPTGSFLTLSGNDSSRIFTVLPSAEVALTRLGLSRGYSRGEGAAMNGGAIYNDHATLTIKDSVFSINTSQVSGGGGAIYNLAGTLEVSSSTFSQNSVYFPIESSNGAGGGALINAAGGTTTLEECVFDSNGSPNGFGGAIVNRAGSPLTIRRSSFTNNSTLGPFNHLTGAGGAIFSNGPLTIESSTFSGNESGDGAAILNAVSTLTVRNSTFANNTAEEVGGAIYSGQYDSIPTQLIVENSTFVGNDGILGAAIYNGENIPFTLRNTIVAGNGTRSSVASDSSLFGPITDGDYNLVDNATDVRLPGRHNIVGQDPKLGTLAFNGGPTQTFAPLPGSPAIDAGNSTLGLDQRGRTRRYDVSGVANAAGGNGSDIGAVEYELAQSGPDFVVNTTASHDDGECTLTDCTLAEAIGAANSAPDTSTITFAPTVFASRQTIDVAGGLLPLSTNINLIGPSAPGAGVTLDNSTTNATLSVSGAQVNIANFTFTGATASAIGNEGTNTTVSGCSIIGTRSGFSNTGSSASSLLIASNCTFSGIKGPAISAVGNKLAVNSCTFIDNGYALFIQRGTGVTLSNSLLARNATPIFNQEVPPGNSRNIRTDHTLFASSLESLGLDPAGAKENGGPTPTVALVAGSPAIDAGATSLATDQRGVGRDSSPDIGAFEGNSAPRVVSVVPQNASDQVGARRTFSITVSDTTGLGDIKEVWLLVNQRLSWNAGATLIYVPSTTSPRKGSLYLRSGDAFLAPASVGAGSRVVLDNGVVQLLTQEVTVTTSGNSLTLNLPFTIRDGLVGQNRVFARVVDKVGATDPIAPSSDNGYRRFGTYTVTPQFSGTTNSAPILSHLTPGATNTTLGASGIASVPQTFVFGVKDENGTGDLESLWLLAGKSLSWANSATFVYQPRSRRLYLRSDDGNSFLGGGVIGSAGILENSQVRLDLSKVKTTIYPDGKTLSVVLPLQAKRGLLGQNKVWLRAQDNQGATAPNGDAQGYVLSGTWSVTQGATAPNSANALSAGHS